VVARVRAAAAFSPTCPCEGLANIDRIHPRREQERGKTRLMLPLNKNAAIREPDGARTAARLRISTLETFDQIVGAGDVGLARRFLEIERLHDAVVHHHSVALRAHTQPALGQIGNQA